MKRILFLTAFLIFYASLSAQLENTIWKSKVVIGNPINVIFDFKKDTVSLYNLADSETIEIMTYTKNDTSFTLMKIDGQSDCDNSIPGNYSFKIKNDSMYMRIISDDCNDRSSVINNTGWKRWKELTAIKVDQAILKQYAGIYQLDEAHPITITLQNGNLYAEGLVMGCPNLYLLQKVTVGST